MKTVVHNQQVQREFQVQSQLRARFTPSVQLNRTLNTNYVQDQVYLPSTNDELLS